LTCGKSALRTALPNIHEEYSAAFPRDNYGGGLLIKMALDCVLDMVKTNESEIFKDDYSRESLVKRWNELSPELIRFLEEATPGAIYRNKTYIPYNTTGAKKIFQQFRNTPPKEPAVFANGKTIIDIGFVDFGIIFDGIENIADGDAPVTVYAIDKEPICVAKCLVMLQMMKIPGCIARNVVEVWMCTLWSKETAALFYSALTSLLQFGSDILPPFPVEVKNILKFWSLKKHKNMTKDSVLQFYIQRKYDHASSIVMNACNLVSPEDRVDCVRLCLTGALYEDESTTVGSVVMCTESVELSK
jgi:hypothetical protein